DAYHGRMPLEGGFAPYTRELRFLFARITAKHTALSVVCIRGGARAARTYLQCSCRNYVAPNRPHEKGHSRLRDRGLRCSDRARHSTRSTGGTGTAAGRPSTSAAILCSQSSRLV